MRSMGKQVESFQIQCFLQSRGEYMKGIQWISQQYIHKTIYELYRWLRFQLVS
jgi:hypothetical protein